MASKNNVAKINPTWHYNIIGHFFVLLIIFITICFIIIIKESLFSKQISIIKNHWYEFSKKLDLKLDDITIQGREKTKPEEISSLLNLDQESSFLAIDEKQIIKNLKTIAWINDVYIKKNYIPNILEIYIQEKEVIALLQKDNQIFALDQNAQIIDANFTPNKEYIIVSGNAAAKDILEILQITSQDKDIFARIKALQYVSDRRWNIILDDIKNGKTIKLSETDAKKSWKKLIKLNQTNGLLKRPLTIIDLRFDNKVILKLNKQPLKKKMKETSA